MKLLGIGASTPANLAKLCDLPRPTVYAILEELNAQGFVHEDLSASKKMFLPTPPEDLKAVLEPLRTEIDRKELLLQELTPLLKNATQGAMAYTPRIVHIPHTRIESYCFSQTAKWNASIKSTGTEYLGFQDTAAPEIFLDWVEWYWAHPGSKDISLRIISNSSDFEKDVMDKREDNHFGGRRRILQWDGMGNLTFSTWICGDYIILCNTRQRPFYLTEIYDPSFAQSQRQIFEEVWKIASKESTETH